MNEKDIVQKSKFSTANDELIFQTLIYESLPTEKLSNLVSLHRNV